MKRRSLLILAAIAFIFASCGNKGGSSGLMIPKDANVVVHINSSSLSSKLSWDEIRQTNWFKAMHTDIEMNDTVATQLLANPASSGVNTTADMVFYMKKHGRSGYMIFTGMLTDAVAFEKLCKEMHSKGEVKKDGDFSYMAKEDGAIVWNKSHFAYAGNARTPGMNTSREKGETLYSPNNFTADSLRIFGIEALSLKNSDNLDRDERFTSMLKDSSDVHIWLNVENYAPGMEAMPMAKTELLLKDNVAAISINFDNGKISAKAKHYYGDEMSKIMAGNKPGIVTADVINRIPSSNVLGVFAFNYSPAALKDIIKLVGADALADVFLSKVNFSIDDFVKANKGEVLLAYSDPNTAVEKQDTIKRKGGSYSIMPHMMMTGKVLFATAVNDKPAFEKMTTVIWDMSKQFGINSDKIGIHSNLQSNWFAVSNSAEYADKFLAGSNSNLPFTDKITGHPIGLYIDLQKMMQSLGSSVTDTANKKGLGNALNMWQDIVAKGGDFKDKAAEFEIEINLVDKNTNSLKQLNQYIDKMAMLKKERKDAWKMKEVRMEDAKDVPVAMPPKKKHK